MGEKSIGVAYFCRICLEEELQHSQRLEAPCACSGTSKFAHRGCIQRWCYEKGDTTCEICLQKFRPGYTSVPPPLPPPPPPRPQEIYRVTDEVITRGFPNLNWAGQNMEVPTEDQDDLFATELPDSTDDPTPSCCKSVFLIFIGLILVKHMFIVLSGGWKFLSGFRNFMVIFVRTCGYIMPMYIIIWIIIVTQKYQQLQRRNRHNNMELEEEQPSRIRDEQPLRIRVER